MKLAVIGHVEHITIARVASLPVAGDIAHLERPRVFPGGGGGVAFYQLLNSPADVLLYTALGDDDAGKFVEAHLATTKARVFAARRSTAHTRDVVMVTPGGQRTIIVVGEPLHPRKADPLPWDELASCDAAYFTAQDPDALRAARAARLLVVTARRRSALIESGVTPDIVVGSLGDPRERSTLADYPKPPRALILTDGARGGQIETAEGLSHFPPAAPPDNIVGSYGAGDSFAAALTYQLAQKKTPLEAATIAARYGAAVLAGLIPLDAQLVL
ncbi:MAG: PfkB family carbohydrate kinase [Kofleriaceae bacterium]